MSEAQVADLDAFLGRAPRAGKRRRLRVLAIVALVLAIALLSLILSRRDAGENFVTEPLEKSDLLVSVTAMGNLRATRQIDVGSETSGLVAEVFVDNNDHVDAGQPLARLDTARLRNALGEAQAMLSQALSQLASAEATAVDARDQLVRQQGVFRASGGQVPSAAELSQTVQAARRANAQIGAARAQVAQSRAQLATARTNLSKATIYAPVSGTVLQRRIEPGQTVAASFETPVLFTIAEDLSRMRLDVRVDEADIARVQAGQSASFTVDAFPGEQFPARVERVDLGATTSGSTALAATSGGGTVVSYIARLQVANAQGRLRPGMTATATIVADRFRARFVVPLSALRFRPPARRAGPNIAPPPPTTESVVEQQVRIGIGSRQRLQVLEADGSLRPVDVIVVAVAGSRAAIEGRDLRPGARIVTGVRTPA